MRAGRAIALHVSAPSRRSFDDTVGTFERILGLNRVDPYRDDDGYGSEPLTPTEKGMDGVLGICERFHEVARQLKRRRENRTTLVITDEYDVQDLLHSLLRLFFDDIRAEEWNSSYAGKSSRMDFLLKNEKIVVEAKKTREGLNARTLGDELLVDGARYRSHPQCEHLVCLVYDPDAIIVNPRGIENDLSGVSDSLDLRVLIRPK